MSVTRVVAAIIMHGDRVLITRRAPKQSLAGGWEFPGGKVKPSETDRACLVREIKEELSIDICVGELCTEVVHDYGPFAINLVAYYCTVSGGEIALTVHDMYQWVKVEDLLDYNLLPADVQIAKAVKEHSKDHLYPS
ncbi:MAG: (deoxy)nucleoside triphosphate pyrophosphohydrolase [Bacillota bacterium]|nr:(deoxy)nucleoside triphosphate pyrophosphohydrolase [Bacillota bacterium]HQD18692.1 (deoxy)nucleoside triphosphate pyrophosphohydrolase [Bacillota bacterium]